MAQNKKNISKKNPSGNYDELKDFLKENLSEDLFSAVENNDDDFMNDAMEGLAEFSSTQKIHGSADKLNKKLIQAAKGKKKTKPFEFKQIFLFIIAVVLILILIFLGYEVISLRK